MIVRARACAACGDWNDRQALSLIDTVGSIRHSVRHFSCADDRSSKEGKRPPLSCFHPTDGKT